MSLSRLSPVMTRTRRLLHARCRNFYVSALGSRSHTSGLNDESSLRERSGMFPRLASISTFTGAHDISSKPTVISEASYHKNAMEEAESKKSSKTDVSSLPPHLVIGMPALSPTMNQGNITRWRKKEGDKIGVGDVICDIETDKATLEFESLEEGFLAKILVPEGSKDVAVGHAIAVTVEDRNDMELVMSSFSISVKKTEEQLSTHDITSKTDKQMNLARISPSAKILILEHGLALSSLAPTGAHGTLLKSDVLTAIRSGKVSKVQLEEALQPLQQTTTEGSKKNAPESKSQSHRSESFVDLPNTQIRKVIAKRLLESKQTTPHLYLTTDVTLDPLLALRKELKEKHDFKVSVNDIVIKAVAVALRDIPKANGYWESNKGEIILCDSVDISIAVATDKGLMTPIIRNADQKSITSISSEVKQLAEKARAGKLAPNEFQGGSFSISNLGMYPVDCFCAIINPPQAGILAVGRGTRVIEPAVGNDGTDKLVVVNKMSLTLSADHRVFCGEVASAFLAALRSNFSDIRRLML